MIEMAANARTIPLADGYRSAIVDAADYEWLAQWKWHFSGHRYAARRASGGSVIYMHRLIAATCPGMKTDHVNGNGLDNRRANLRHATAAQNVYNARLSKKNTSGFRGVSFIVCRGKWRAAIRVDNRSISLGYFTSAEEAAAVRQVAERELFGDFANLPVPEGCAHG